MFILLVKITSKSYIVALTLLKNLIKTITNIIGTYISIVLLVPWLLEST